MIKSTDAAAYFPDSSSAFLGAVLLELWAKLTKKNHKFRQL